MSDALIVRNECPHESLSFSSIESTWGGLLSCGIVTGNGTISSYVIEWRKDSIKGGIVFTSGYNTTNYINAIHPFTDQCVCGGTLYATIRYIVIDGIKYSPYFREGQYSPDLLSCLGTISIDTNKDTYVPYIGATKDVDLNTHSLAASGIKLSTTNPLIVVNPGEIGWNTHDRTINIKTPNTTIQVSQEHTFPVKNVSGSTLLDGRLIRITGYDTINDYYTVDYSDNGSEATAYVDFMLSESIADGDVGLATKVGLVHGIDTSSGVSNNPVYLSTSGQFINTEPTYPSKSVVVGTYGHIDAINGDIFVDLNKSSQYEINKITNELELKGMQNPGICQKCPITENDIVINTTDLTLTITTVNNGTTISAANPIRFFTDGGGVIYKWEKTSPVTFTFTNITGIWYFYFDSSGNPIASQVPWSDYNIIAPVYRIYWNASLSGAERLVVESVEYHINNISASDHMWKHNEGTKHLSGADYVANVLSTGTPNADGRNAVISLTTGTLVDDNLLYTVTNSSSGVIKFTQDLGNIIAGSLNNTNSGQFMIRITDAGGLLNRLPATRFPFAWSPTTNRPQYITQTGVRTEVTNQYFFVYFIYSLQDPRRGEAIKIVSALTEYATKTLADASSWEQLQAVYPALRDNEIRLLYKLTFECRHSVPNPYDVGTKYSVLRQVDDLRKLKITSSTVASGTVLASNVVVTPVGGISSTDGQSAFAELDAEKAPVSGSANYIQNQNSTHQTANLDITGSGYFGTGVNIASGQTYKINGTQISSSALSNNSNLTKYDDVTKTFTGTGTTTFNGIVDILKTNTPHNAPNNIAVKIGETSKKLLLGYDESNDIAFVNASNGTLAWESIGIATVGGFVLIGTEVNNANAKLQVNGDITTTGYKLSGASLFLDPLRTGYAGTAGQFFISTGINTTPAWTTLSSTMVTTALGYTPYNATNPSGFISAITKSMVESVLTGTITSHNHSGLLSQTPHAETANTNCTLDLHTYVNSKISTNTNISFTLSNLDEGATGNIEFTFTGTAIITFIVDNTLTLNISPNILGTVTNAYTNTLISKSSGTYITSYYRSGQNVYINGR